jgi:hypothetical protein
VSRIRFGAERGRAAARSLSFVVALMLSGAARPQPVPAASPTAPMPSIEIVVVGRADAYERLHALLDRRLSAVGSTTWSRAERVDAGEVLAASPRHALRCWIDLGDRRRARLTFAARSGERFLVRDFELSGDLDEIDRAAVAEVIDLSLGALLEDERAGLSRGETEALLANRAVATPGAPTPAQPSPAPPVAPPLPADAPSGLWRGRRFELGVFYAAELVADGLPIDNGPGLSLALSGETRRHVFGARLFSGGWTSARLLLPEAVTGTDAKVRLVGVAPRMGIELGFERLRLRIGAGWDFVHVSSEASSAALAPAGAHWTSMFACEAAIRFAIVDARSSHLWISLLADMLPAAVDYGVDAGGRFEATFSPWLVRPGLALELMFP